MKKIILFIIPISLGLILESCKKDEPTPQQTPTEPQPTLTTYNDFVIIANQPMDSVVLTNTTNGMTEHITADVTAITCNAVESDLSKFHLTNSASTGNQISVTVYHSAFTWGGLPITRFLANANTDLCDEFGGNNLQTANGNSTTFTFTAQ